MIYLNLKVFIDIHEYSNQIICIFDQGVKGQCLGFNWHHELLSKEAAAEIRLIL